MTTPPQGPASPSESQSDQGIQPHQARKIAESFGSDPDRYDRSRPRYPDALVHRIIESSPGTNIVDVGCGTGIASRQFQAAGCRVLGVEVDARMADLARRYGIEVEVSAFEQWDPAGRVFDAVVAAQAWHWVDPAAGAAKAALALRNGGDGRGGRLAVFWNVFQPAPDLAQAFAEVQRRVLPEAPVFWTRPALEGYAPMFSAAANGIAKAGGYGEPEDWRFEWEHRYTRDAWLEQLPTHGGVSQLPSDKLVQLLEGTGDAIDAIGGSFTMKYTSVVVTAARGEAA